MVGFWNDTGLEPKRAYRFLLSVVGTDTQIPQFLIKKVSKPGFTITESEHKYLNHTFYYPGKITWDEVEFTIVDAVGTNASTNATAAVMKVLNASGYRSPMAYESQPLTISKKLAADAMAMTIRQIDAEGKSVEEWKLHGAWVKSVKFGELDYDSEDLLNVIVTVRYDHAHVKITGGKTYPTNALG
jgi:hypothetical protein